MEVAKAKFVELVGKEPPHYIRRVHLPSYLNSTSPEMAVKMALDNNNSLKVAKSNVQIAEADYQETGSKLLPTVTLEGEAQRNRNIGGTTGRQNRFAAMLVARHNIFSGGKDVAGSREASKRLAEAQARLSLARRQLERTVRSAWGEAKSAQAKSANLTRLIREKRLIRDAYLDEFAIGRRSLIDILDAANEVFITEASRTSVDAVVDVSVVTLSVNTAQFKGYMNRADEHEGEDDKYKDEIRHSVTLSPYALTIKEPSLKPITHTKMKKEPVKRRSVFDKRKESRNRALLDKGDT